MAHSQTGWANAPTLRRRDRQPRWWPQPRLSPTPPGAAWSVSGAQDHWHYDRKGGAAGFSWSAGVSLGGWSAGRRRGNGEVRCFPLGVPIEPLVELT